jgi:hypothetical protein
MKLAFVHLVAGVGSTAFPVLVGKVGRRSRTGDLLQSNIDLAPGPDDNYFGTLTGSYPGLILARGFVFLLARESS